MLAERAALSYGALKALYDTHVRAPTTESDLSNDNSIRLASEVDYVSSVSGGSVTASHWALLGPDAIVPDYEEAFLARKVRTELIRALSGKGALEPSQEQSEGLLERVVKRLIEPDFSAKSVEDSFSIVDSLPPIVRLLSDGYSRVDFLSEYYQTTQLEQKTYRDLLTEAVKHGDRPYLVLNATDIVTRSLFPFVQIQYDLMCSDLNELVELKLADALAASTAYPAVFNSFAIENWRAKENADRTGEDACAGVFALEQVTPHAPVLTLGESLNENVSNISRGQSENVKALQNVEAKQQRIRTELVQATDVAQEGHLRFEVALRAVRSGRDELQNIGQEFEKARRREATAKDVLRLVAAYERARDNTRNKTTRALRRFETESDHIESRSGRALSELDEQLQAAKEAVGEHVALWLEVLVSFPDRWLKGLLQLISAEQLASTSIETPMANPSSVSQSGGEFTGSVVTSRQGPEWSEECDVDVSPPMAQEMGTISYTLHQFANWTKNESNLEDTTTSDEQSLHQLPGQRIPLSDEWVMPSQNWKRKMLSHRAAQARLAALNRRTVESRRWVRELEGSLRLGNVDLENARVVLRLLDDLEATIQGVDERVGQAFMWARARRLSSVISFAEKHVEALRLAQAHIRNRAEVRTLRQRLGVERCKAERLRALTGKERRQLQSKADEALDQWIVAKDKSDTASSEYRRARQEVSRLNHGLDVARKELIEAQSELRVAKVQYRRALDRKGTLERTLTSVNKDFRDVSETGEELKAQYRRANALRSDYQFTARRVRKQVPYYFDTNLQYVHLLDGGVADNLGVTPLLELLTSFREEFCVDYESTATFAKCLNNVAIFAVDARRASGADFGKELTSPGLLETLDATISTAIEGKSSLLTEELERATEGLVRDGIVGESHLVRINFDMIRNFHVHTLRGGEGHIHGADVEHSEDWEDREKVDYPRDTLEECVRAFKAIPTDWDLEAVEKQALTRIGYALVRDSVEYVSLVNKFKGRVANVSDTVVDVCSSVTEDLKKEAEKRRKKGDGKDDGNLDIGSRR